MTLASPSWLWLLVAVGGLAAGYLIAQRRRPRYAIRFTTTALLDVVAPERPGWRRHLPAIAVLAALGVLAVALAGPQREVLVPREQATVVLAVDTSPSMLADDVAPSRFEALKRAASDFARELPDGFSLGLVAFSATAQVVVAPTTDHEQVVRALDRLDIRERTALGEAIFASLDAVDLADLRAEAERGEEPPAAAIVLMSDGESTAGRAPELAVAEARDLGVPVSTIAFGTPFGVIELEGQVIPVPVAGETLRLIAQQTGGVPFEAASLAELEQVYDDIGFSLGRVPEPRDISRWFTALAVALLFVAAGLSLRWFARLP